MKRKTTVVLFILAFTLLFITGCRSETPASSAHSAPESENAPLSSSRPEAAPAAPGEVTMDRAFEIALSHAGTDAANAVVDDSEQTQDNGRTIFKFSFSSPQYFSFEYDIDAKSGRILDYKCDWNDAKGKPDGLTDSFDVSEDQALALVLGHAGVGAGQVTVKSVQTIVDKGISIYQVECFNDLVEYDYYLSGSSGALLQYECEWQSYERIV